jgi:hypothetical protein
VEGLDGGIFIPILLIYFPCSGCVTIWMRFDTSFINWRHCTVLKHISTRSTSATSGLTNMTLVYSIFCVGLGYWHDNNRSLTLHYRFKAFKGGWFPGRLGLYFWQSGEVDGSLQVLTVTVISKELARFATFTFACDILPQTVFYVGCFCCRL